MQVVGVHVVRREIEAVLRLRGERVLLRREEGSVERVVGVEHEGAAVVGVVAHPEVHDGRLRTGGFDGGIAVDDAGRGVEAGIADAKDADLALLLAMFLSSQSTVSDMSVDSSMPLPSLEGVISNHLPSLFLRPRTSWQTRM